MSYDFIFISILSTSVVTKTRVIKFVPMITTYSSLSVMLDLQLWLYKCWFDVCKSSVVCLENSSLRHTRVSVSNNTFIWKPFRRNTVTSVWFASKILEIGALSWMFCLQSSVGSFSLNLTVILYRIVIWSDIFSLFNQWHLSPIWTMSSRCFAYLGNVALNYWQHFINHLSVNHINLNSLYPIACIPWQYHSLVQHKVVALLNNPCIEHNINTFIHSEYNVLCDISILIIMYYFHKLLHFLAY